MPKKKRVNSSKRSQPADQKLISPEDLGSRWAVSPRTLANWRSDGDGPKYTKIGKRIFYLENDVKRYELMHRKGG